MMKHSYDRETVLKAIRFERPDFIPMQFCINPACWTNYPQEELLDLMEAHPFLFPNFVRPQLPFQLFYSNVQRKDQPYVDDWGCTWQTTMDGITGTVTGHPLDDWSKFAGYGMPDPEKCMGIGAVDWAAEERAIQSLKKAGEIVIAGLRHGHTFLQASDIRGYQNLIFDMVDEEPDLDKLLDMILEFNLGIIKHYLEMDVDIITYAEDLGMQRGPMLSPDQFRQYFLPRYRKMIQPAKEKGTIIHMHSDGDIRTLVSLLTEGGVDVLNLQDLVNGIDWIKENLKGKMCIDLDIDRQHITTFGTPKDVDDLILNEVKELGSKQGGLMMVYGLYPGVPLENAKALMEAMEKYAFYYA